MKRGIIISFLAGMGLGWLFHKAFDYEIDWDAEQPWPRGW